jgi:HK97 family phage major capsid protein
MASIRELIQQLYDKRRNLVEQQRELNAQVEADLNGEYSGETEAKHQEFDKDIRELGSRIDNLLSMEEQAKETDAQRERFEKLVRSPDVVRDDEKAFEDRMRTWLRAGLPNADVWAPRSITVNMRPTGYGPMEQHDLTKGAAGAGAELMPVSFVQTLQEHLIEFAAIRQTNTQIFSTNSGENLLVPKTTGHGTATLIAEAGAVLENDPVFAQVTLNAYKYGVMIQVSNELLTDSAIDLLGYLARAVGISIGTVTGTAYVLGTGSSQPQGIANAGTAGVTGGSGTGLTVAGNDLISLYHSVVSGYRTRAFWVMNDLTAAYIRKLRDDTGGSGLGNFLWQPGLVAGRPDTILGRPVVTDPNVAVMAINALSIAFGDFSAYFAIRDVNSLRFERSDDFAFANDLVSFRALIRTDSKQLVNGAAGAVKFYKNGAS